MEKFAGGGMSSVVENYCLWALRMLVMEPGVPETLANMSCVRSSVFPKLAMHIQKSESRVQALAVMSVMCAVPTFCEALSKFPGKQDLLISMVIEPGPGRTWALQELASSNISVLLKAAGYLEAITALLQSQNVLEQKAGLDLCEQALAMMGEENLRFVPLPLVVKGLPASAKVISLACESLVGRQGIRAIPGALASLAEWLINGRSAPQDHSSISRAVSLLCRDAENGPVMVKLGVIAFMSMSKDPAHVESLSHLCASSAECRAVLLAQPNYVSGNLLPLLAESPSSVQLLSILTSLLREPSFRSCRGICAALLKNSPVDGNLLDALMVLPQGDLYNEGAFDKAVELLNAAPPVRTKALHLVKRMSLHAAGDKLSLISMDVLLGFVNEGGAAPGAALFLLDLMMRDASAAFLAQGGLNVLLRAAGRDGQHHAAIAQVLHRAIADPAFDKSTAPAVVEFCSSVLTSEQPPGVAQFLALQLLKELYTINPEQVAAVVSSPAVVKRVTANPWLLEALKFFFQA
jgi:hypothetical protein